MSESLGGYIQRTIEARWEWGVCDCTMWVADWVVSQTGIDPASALRGTYASEAEADALVARGLAAVVDGQGVLSRTDAPAPGDVGVIHVGGREVAAIMSADGWVFRQPDSVGSIRTEPLAAWALPTEGAARMNDAPGSDPAADSTETD